MKKASAASLKESDIFLNEVIEASNRLRQNHNSLPLKHNKNISKVSQEWADHLAKNKLFQHNPKAIFNKQHLGENLSFYYNSEPEHVYHGNDPVEKWYKEIDDYDFEKHTGENTGHFTQLVWGESTEVGVARARQADGTWIVVCNYLPAGNIIGEYAKNVRKPLMYARKSQPALQKTASTQRKSSTVRTVTTRVSGGWRITTETVKRKSSDGSSKTSITTRRSKIESDTD